MIQIIGLIMAVYCVARLIQVPLEVGQVNPRAALELGTVRPGETVTVRLDDCTTDGGERFDWQRRKPTAVGVITAQGSKYFQP